eukprot:7054618-Lingulodinium_polyedra.AAC.1
MMYDLTAASWHRVAHLNCTPFWLATCPRPTHLRVTSSRLHPSQCLGCTAIEAAPSTPPSRARPRPPPRRPPMFV